MVNTPQNKKHLQVQVNRKLYDDSSRVLSDHGQIKSERLSFELERQVCHSNIPVIKDPQKVDRYLLKNGDDRYDEHK